MKTVPISEEPHRRMRILISTGCPHKTIKEFVDFAVAVEVERLKHE
jgi:hypothetical protein